MKQESKSTKSRAGSTTRRGIERDTTLENMRKDGIPLTRENYIKRAYGGIPSEEDWGPELEAMLPKMFQNRNPKHRAKMLKNQPKDNK
jgi:hypothetical protein